MANVVNAKSLWTPEGEKFLARDVEVIPKEHMRLFRDFHVIAQRLNISLVCLRCNRPYMGKNQGGETVYVVECGCREVRAPRA